MKKKTRKSGLKEGGGGREYPAVKGGEHRQQAGARVCTHRSLLLLRFARGLGRLREAALGSFS